MINPQRVLKALQLEINDLEGQSSEWARGAVWAFWRARCVVKRLMNERKHIQRAFHGVTQDS